MSLSYSFKEIIAKRHIAKFNHNHDPETGRFASGSDGNSAEETRADAHNKAWAVQNGLERPITHYTGGQQPENRQPIDGKDLSGTDFNFFERQINSDVHIPIQQAQFNTVAHEQGFDGLPQVCHTQEEFDKACSESDMLLERYVFADNDTILDTYNKTLTDGDFVANPSNNARFGMGLYTSEARPSNPESVKFIEDFMGQQTRGWDDDASQQVYKMTLQKDAKIADYDVLAEELHEGSFQDEAGWSINFDTIAGGVDDVGTYAAYRGFDAVRVYVGSKQSIGVGRATAHTNYIVVLNRSKLIVLDPSMTKVEKADAKLHIGYDCEGNVCALDEDGNALGYIHDFMDNEAVEKYYKDINGCGVLVVKDGKLLVGNRIERNGKGQICGGGGHIEDGETPMQAASREMQEEFGIICENMEFLGIQDSGKKYGKSAVFYCDKFSEEPKCDEVEMTDARWVDVEELTGNLFPPFERSLELLPKAIQKYNHNHGADGRFTTGTGTPTAIKVVADSIRNLDHEENKIVNSDGEVLFSSTGDENSVASTVGDYREYAEGAYLIHNHPTGGTFSAGDLNKLGYGCKEMRVASPEGDYIMSDANNPDGKSGCYCDWVGLREKLYEAELESFKDITELSKVVFNEQFKSDFDEKVGSIAQKWTERKDAGASEEELQAIIDEYNEAHSKWTAENEEARKKAVRQAYVNQWHQFYIDNAKEHGIDYRFEPTIKKYNHNHDALGRFTTGNEDSDEANTKTRGHLDRSYKDNKAEAISLIAKECGCTKSEAEVYHGVVSMFTDSTVTTGNVRKAQRGEHENKVDQKAFSATANILEDYISKAPQWNGGMIYRGVSKAEEAQFYNNIEVGDVVDMGGVSSWSSEKSAADFFATEGFDVEHGAVFVCNNVKNATSIKHLSRFPKEGEILVSSNQKFRITRKSTDGKRTIFYVEDTEAVTKYNHNHDSITGRFTSGSVSANSEFSASNPHGITDFSSVDYDGMTGKMMKLTGYSEKQAEECCDNIFKWSFGQSTQMRQAQRGELDYTDGTFLKMANSIEQFIYDAPQWNGGTLYRGIDATEKDKFYNNIKKGGCVDMGGLASWTDDIEVADAFTHGKGGLIFETDTPGYATSIAQFSAMPQQKEVLTPSSAVFRVESVENGCVRLVAVDDYGDAMESVQKYNHNHDEKGRFTFSSLLGINNNKHAHSHSSDFGGHNRQKPNSNKRGVSYERRGTGEYFGRMDRKTFERGHLETKDGKIIGVDNLEYTREECIQTELGCSRDEAVMYSKAVKMFSENEYYDSIRQSQRDGEPSKAAQILDEYIENAPQWNGGALYRGIEQSEEHFYHGLQEGDVIDMGGASSWSSLEEVATGYADDGDGTLFVIDNPTKGTSIRHLSEFPHEYEVVVSSKTTFIVKSVEIDQWGARTVHLQQSKLPVERAEYPHGEMPEINMWTGDK